MKTDDVIYFRPPWTCGRYDAKNRVAILYNLLEGYSFFFEEYSADVIGAILQTPRNGEVAVLKLAEQTNIHPESIIAFCDELKDNHRLLTKVKMSEYAIKAYRTQVAQTRILQSQTTEKTIEEKLPFVRRHAEREYHNKASSAVSSVMFELTYNCSEKCIHCYNIGATRNDNEVSHRNIPNTLTFSDYVRIIDDMYEHGLIKVCLSGGDPFSHPDVWKIIDYLYQKEIVIDVYTNGQSIVNQAERLANYYPNEVGISLYSGNAADHDFITRIKGSWERSMKVIAQLSELAVPLQIKCCVLRTNAKSYYLVADIAKKYGAELGVELNIHDSIDNDTCVSRQLRLTPEQLEIILRDPNSPMYIGQEAPGFGGYKRILDSVACAAGDTTFCLSPDGKLMPCCAFHLYYGDFHTHTFAEIIETSVTRRSWQKLKLQDYEECGRHDYCDYCNLCAGNNFSAYGTPTKAAESNCFMAKARYNLANKLRNGDDPLKGRTLAEALAALPDQKPTMLHRQLRNELLQ